MPPLSSVVQLESDVIKSASSKTSSDSSEATPTTETVATSSPKTTESGAENTSAEIAVKLPGETDISVLNVGGESADGPGGSSIIIEASSSSSDSLANPNDTDSDGAKDSSSEEGDRIQTGTNNPKLVFIERLMGLNFQRAPTVGGGFSSFLEMRGENDSNDEKNKTDSSSNSNSDDNEGPEKSEGINSSELPWGYVI